MTKPPGKKKADDNEEIINKPEVKKSEIEPTAYRVQSGDTVDKLVKAMVAAEGGDPKDADYKEKLADAEAKFRQDNSKAFVKTGEGKDKWLIAGKEVQMIGGEDLTKVDGYKKTADKVDADYRASDYYQNTQPPTPDPTTGVVDKIKKGDNPPPKAGDDETEIEAPQLNVILAEDGETKLAEYEVDPVTGKRTREVQFSEDGKTKSAEIEFNQTTEKPAKVTWYEEDGTTVRDVETYEYDDKGNTIKEVNYYTDGTIQNITDINGEERTSNNTERYNASMKSVLDGTVALDSGAGKDFIQALYSKELPEDVTVSDEQKAQIKEMILNSKSGHAIFQLTKEPISAEEYAKIKEILASEDYVHSELYYSLGDDAAFRHTYDNLYYTNNEADIKDNVIATAPLNGLNAMYIHDNAHITKVLDRFDSEEFKDVENAQSRKIEILERITRDNTIMDETTMMRIAKTKGVNSDSLINILGKTKDPALVDTILADIPNYPKGVQENMYVAVARNLETEDRKKLAEQMNKLLPVNNRNVNLALNDNPITKKVLDDNNIYVFKKGDNMSSVIKSKIIAKYGDNLDEKRLNYVVDKIVKEQFSSAEPKIGDRYKMELNLPDEFSDNWSNWQGFKFTMQDMGEVQAKYGQYRSPLR